MRRCSGRVRWSGSSIQRRRSSTSRSFPSSSIRRAEAYQRRLLCWERRTSSSMARLRRSSSLWRARSRNFTTLKSAFARVQGWATAIALTILALNLGLDARQSSSSAATGSTQQIKITAAHQTDAVANETDRRVPEARSPPSVLLNSPQSEQRDRDGAIARAAEPTISRPQACAETSKSLLGEFRLFGPLAFAQVSPKAKRRLRAVRRRLIERKHYCERRTNGRPLAHPELVFVPSVAKQQVHAVRIFTDGRLARPGVRPK